MTALFEARRGKMLIEGLAGCVTAGDASYLGLRLAYIKFQVGLGWP